MGVFFRYRGIEQNVNEKIDIFFYVKSSKYIHIIITEIYIYVYMYVKYNNNNIHTKNIYKQKKSINI